MKTWDRLMEKSETSLHFSLTSSSGVRPAEEAWVVNRASMWSRMGACEVRSVCVCVCVCASVGVCVCV